MVSSSMDIVSLSFPWSVLHVDIDGQWDMVGSHADNGYVWFFMSVFIPMVSSCVDNSMDDKTTLISRVPGKVFVLIQLLLKISGMPVGVVADSCIPVGVRGLTDYFTLTTFLISRMPVGDEANSTI